MTAKLINGRILAQSIRQTLADKIASWRARNIRVPCLAMTLVGDDPASQIYVANKARACAEIGLLSKNLVLPATVSQAGLLEQISALNQDPNVDGILVQLPLPSHINRWEIIGAISPDKDVDGLTPHNQGLMVWAKPGLYSCTPLGIMALIQSTGVAIEGAFAAVVGRSVLVGGPTATLVGNAGATVVGIHSKSRNVPELTRQADILVVAAGEHHLVQQHWVKPGAVVIDVGIHRVGTKVRGDVNFDAVSQVAGHITPVPGGVGPMTIAMLLHNCVMAYEMRLGLTSPQLS